MTISTAYSPTQYTGNGATLAFSTAWPFFDTTDIKVEQTVISTGVTTDVTGSVTITGGSGSAGTVTFGVAPTTDHRITITREVPYEQGQDYVENTAFKADNIERGFDRGVVLAQQNKALIDRALVFDNTLTGILTPTITEAPVSGFGLVWDGTSGNLRNTTSSLANLEGDAETVADNIASVNTVASSISNVNAVAGNNANIDTVAGISANVTTVSTISANVTTVAGINSEITNVSGISADVSAVAAISSDVTAAANNIPKANRTATTDPTVNDDSGDDYSEGSLWVNTTTDTLFFCVDPSAGAAVWQSVAASLSGQSDVTITSPQNEQPLVYDTGTSQWINSFNVQATDVKAATSGGISIKGSGGGTAVQYGAGGGTGSTFAGGVIFQNKIFCDDEVSIRDDGELTVATGAVTITGSNHTIDTESDAATDDLDTINGGSNGEILIIRAADAARTVVIKHGTGNISTPDGNDITLDETNKVATLFYDAELSQWNVVSSPVSNIVDAQSVAKAWVSFNGTGTLAILDSYNVTSVTDNGTGDYTVNLSITMAAAIFPVSLSGKEESGNAGSVVSLKSGTPVTTTSVAINNRNTTSGATYDSSYVSVIIYGDVA